MAAAAKDWMIPGPCGGHLTAADHARRMLAEAERRPPSEADAPTPSTFPMTRAAREALRLARESRRRSRV